METGVNQPKSHVADGGTLAFWLRSTADQQGHPHVTLNGESRRCPEAAISLFGDNLHVQNDRLYLHVNTPHLCL